MNDEHDEHSKLWEYTRTAQNELFANAGDMPKTFIQWKGTAVCLDFHCKCGRHLHFDEEFLYAVECAHCRRVYAMGDRVPVFDVTGTEHEQFLRTRSSLKVGEED